MGLQEKNKINANDVKDYFINNVINFAISNAVDNNSIPRFSGSQNGYTNPLSLPPGDLKNRNDAANEFKNAFTLPEKGKKISVRDIYNAVIHIMGKMSTIRRFDSNWYHKVNNDLRLINSRSGKAVFKESLPGLHGFNPGSNVKTDGWSRNKGSALQSFPSYSFSPGEKIKASDVINFFNDLRGKWQSLYNNAIVYNYYTCHNNCHSNCHGRRGRR